MKRVNLTINLIGVLVHDPSDDEEIKQVIRDTVEEELENDSLDYEIEKEDEDEDF